MSLTGAMQVGFTGVQTNQIRVDTVGDNLANLNTTAFKGQRTLFETLLYRTISEGDAPTARTGGTLPEQIGTGAGVAVIQRNFAQGAIQSTGFASDLAVDGQGFFILTAADGAQVYTRDGAFSLDAADTLVSAHGAPVQVFGVGADGAIDTSTLTNLVVPIGTTGEAVATTAVVMDGQLDAAGSVATEAAVVVSAPLVTSTGAPATASTELTSLVDATGVPMFATGDRLTINASKGGLAIPEATFEVGVAGSTLGDLAAFLESTLGIQGDPATGGEPGVTIAAGPEPPAGSLVITSNLGSANAISLDGASIRNTTGPVASPFAFTTVSDANGEALTTSFRVYDSLGNPVDVRLRLAMESKTEGGTTWRFFAESADSGLAMPVLGTGTISFDQNGKFIAATGTTLSIDRSGTGAATPLTFDLDFGGLTGLSSSDGTSELIMASQDGTEAGVLIGFDIAQDGIVTANFSNQQTELLGQIALATFANSEGLVALSDNVFRTGPNSGDPTVLEPLTGAAGFVVSGALEQSNVEISREFINLITASTGISAAGRVIRTADDLLQELLLLAR